MFINSCHETSYINFYLKKDISILILRLVKTSGAITGVISTCLNNPIDVLKTEMQSKNSSFKHESIISGVKYLVSKKGVSFLFTAGLYARVFKISIGQAVIFQIIEWM